MRTFGIAMAYILVILAVMLLGFGLNYTSFAQYKFFAPRMEQVRHDTFAQSQSYTDGMQRDLDKLQMEYERSTPEQQIGLRDVVIHRFAAYNGPLTPREEAFYNRMRSGN